MVWPLATKRRGFRRCFGFAAACSLFAHGQAQYHAVVLDNGGFLDADGRAMAGGVAYGRVMGAGQVIQHAAEWFPDGAFTDLNPDGYAGSFLNGAGSGAQVGVALSSGNRAGLWRGAAGSFVELHSSLGLPDSVALATNGAKQVGYTFDFSHERAALWSGTAQSYVDTTPQGFAAGRARAIAEDGRIGGNADGHAIIWQAGGMGFVDVHPTEFTGSGITAMSGDEQAGIGVVPATGRYHALKWSGTLASAVDLHPTGFTFSAAWATNGQLEAGEVRLTGGIQHAALWSGSAATFLDLQTFLEPGYSSSVAYGVDEFGNVAGTAMFGSRARAILWQPVPESSSGLALAILCAFGWRYARRTARCKRST